MFGPLEKVCRSCKVPFVFTAAEQKHWYETLRFHIDSTAVRCGPCRRALRRLELARKRYEKAVHAVADAPSKKTHLDAAAATLQVIRAGGRAPIDRAIGHARRAQALGADASALIRELKSCRDK